VPVAPGTVTVVVPALRISTCSVPSSLPSHTWTCAVPGPVARSLTVVEPPETAGRPAILAVSERGAAGPAASGTPVRTAWMIDSGAFTDRVASVGMTGGGGVVGMPDGGVWPGRDTRPHRYGSPWTPPQVDQPIRVWPVLSWVSES
jgi:hypothetical protein